MTLRTAIFVSGGGSNMVALLDAMAASNHPACPALVFSNSADAGGLTKAAARGVPTAVVDHKPFGSDRAAFEAQISKTLAPFDLDLICLAGFMRKLTSGFTDQWQGRMLNIHPSLLPKYKGLNTHQRALDAGDVLHGCTVHEVTERLDDGNILGQARLEIAQDETAETLAARVLKLEHQLYPQVLHRFALGEKGVINLSG